MWTRLSALFFAHTCIFCQESVTDPFDLCRYCLADLPLSGVACESCALPLTEAPPSPPHTPMQCGRCIKSPPTTRHAVSCCHYSYPADFLVLRLKFAGQLKYARVMGQLLARQVTLTNRNEVDLLIPIPLSPGRLRERGYNQAAEIARFAARSLGIPMRASVLSRPSDQRPQTELGRRLRSRNVLGVFRCHQNLAGLRCAIIDDVMTTGATAFEAAKVLLAAGAESVDVWVFARTPV